MQMNYIKQAIDISQQIEILQERGLIIEDLNDASITLNTISYFRLANYWRPMEMDKISHQFKPNSRLGDIISLYNFDKELRMLLFSAIQEIEIALRTKMIHYCSLQFGAFWFMEQQLSHNSRMFAENFSHIKLELSRSKEDFILEHNQRYDNPPYPPAWKTLEVISFGTLSKLYNNLSDTVVKKKIARDFMLPQHLYLESWMRCLAVLRNCCAHHARIWNRHFPMKPQLPQKLPLPWIVNKNISVDKIYPQLCCVIYWLNSIHGKNTFKSDFLKLIDSYPNVDITAMGFPEDWKDEEIW
jgi:abortive infection bacteriophage resistance protein